MLLYYWSHWFWITLLCNILLSVTIVNTYPTRNISLEYSEQNAKSSTNTVTKLTSTTLTWETTAAPNINKITDALAAEKTVLQNVSPELLAKERDLETLAMLAKAKEEDEIYYDNETAGIYDEETTKSWHPEESSENSGSEDYHVKRSAETYNKTNSLIGNEKSVDKQIQAPAKNDKQIMSDNGNSRLAETKANAEKSGAQISNYANSSTAARIDSINDNLSLANRIEHSTTAASAPMPPKLAEQSFAETASVPLPPKIESKHSTLERFNTMNAELLPLSHNSTTAYGVVNNFESESVTAAAAQKVPFTLENANKEDELRRAETEHRTRKSKGLSAEYKQHFINYPDSKSLLTRSASTAPNEFDIDGESNISSEALAIQRTYFLDAGTISAICFAVFGICCTVATVGIVLYRRRYLNKPQALSDPDSSVYIDDSTMRDNSDEMYSLDNDSFLNSLEAMTIQNYWTDTVKHTKL